MNGFTSLSAFRPTCGRQEDSALVGMLCGERLVYIDTEAGLIPRMHVAGFEPISVREDFVRKCAVMHVLLDAEVMDGEAEMEGCRHGDGREIRGSVGFN